MATTVLRALIAIVAGVLMVEYREEMVKMLTILTGILFFLSGFVSVVWYYVMKNKYDKNIASARENPGKDIEITAVKPSIPVAGFGSALLGIILAIFPETVTTWLVYVFAVILILGAVGEFVALITVANALREFKRNNSAATGISQSCLFYILPALLLLFAVSAIVYPHFYASAPLMFIGCAFIVYGVSELINMIQSLSVRRRITKASTAESGADGGKNSETTEGNAENNDAKATEEEATNEGK